MCIFKNDWYPVWTKRGELGITYHCYFEILYSPSRKKYRLKCGGFNPKVHIVYQEAVKKFNDFVTGKSNHLTGLNT